DWWCIRQNAEPAQRIDPLVSADRARRHALAAYAVKAVAAGDEIAGDLVGLAVGAIAHTRRIAGNIVHAHALRRIDSRSARGGTSVHEIFGDFGLAVDHDGLAGQLFERQPMTRPVDADLHALMDETIGMHARADTGFIQQIHRDLFDNAGAHAAEYVVGGLSLQDDIVDASTLQELAEEQPGRTGADNDDLGSHFRQNTTRLGAAGLIVLSPPLDEQVFAQLIREQLFPDLDCPSGGLSR